MVWLDLADFIDDEEWDHSVEIALGLADAG